MSIIIKKIFVEFTTAFLSSRDSDILSQLFYRKNMNYNIYILITYNLKCIISICTIFFTINTINTIKIYLNAVIESSNKNGTIQLIVKY